MAKRLIPSFKRVLAEKIVHSSKTTAGIPLLEKTAKVVSVPADNHYKRISHELLPRRSARDSNNDEVNTSDTQIAELEKSNIPLMDPTDSDDEESLPFGEEDLASDERMWSLYERWMAQNLVSRDLGEKIKRFNVFKENAKFVLELNKKYGCWMYGLNNFADISREEFKRTYLMSTCIKYESDDDSMYENVNSLPASVDSRAQGVVNAVKDQGEYGVSQYISFGEKDLASDESLWSLYERWLDHIGVSRDLGEKRRRFNAFKEKAKFVHEFNKEQADKEVPDCTVGLNIFADTPHEEFMANYTGGFESDMSSREIELRLADKKKRCVDTEDQPGR